MYKKILVPVDGSSTSKRGLDEAIQLAKAFGSQLRLLHVVNEFVITDNFGEILYPVDVVSALRDQGKLILDEAKASAAKAGIEAQTIMLESFGGAAADFIISQASAWPADLIVMGTHGRRGIRRLTLGSDAEQVLRHSAAPVLLVRSVAEAPATVRDTSVKQAATA